MQTTRGVDLGNLSETEAVAQSFVVQYVLARETFDAADYKEQYRKTLAWSQGAAETEYLRDWDRSNPNGIQSRVSPNTRIQVTVKSVTILGPRSAMIRFDTERSEAGGGPGMRQPWVASVVYSFSGKPIAEQDRYLNPLGFQISSYRRDGETTQPVAIPAAPPPMMPAPTTGVTTLPVPGAAVTGTMPGTPGVQPAAPATPGAQPQSKSGNPNGEEFPAQ